MAPVAELNGCDSDLTWHQHPRLCRPRYRDLSKIPTPVPPQIDRAFMGRYRARKLQKIDEVWVFTAFVGETRKTVPEPIV